LAGRPNENDVSESSDRRRAETAGIAEVMTIDRPDQLKALGHPLRVRVLEMLGGDETWQLTNRELAQALAVDPGHLHFHVRMLLRAGLIELAPGSGKGREKPYRAVARMFRVAPDLLAAGHGNDLQAAMLDEVQRSFVAYSSDGRFRAAQLTIRLDQAKAVELAEKMIEDARGVEDESADKIVLTVFAHPPATRDDS
jgi:DNA-binding transcriptional ArsR family regulator